MPRETRMADPVSFIRLLATAPTFWKTMNNRHLQPASLDNCGQSIVYRVGIVVATPIDNEAF